MTHGKSDIHIAAEKGDLRGLRERVEAGASPNARDVGDRTPLHCAANKGRASIVRYLLHKVSGVDMDAQDRQGWTPLHCAANKGHLEVAKLLADAGAKVGVRNRNGDTPDQLARLRNRINVYGGTGRVRYIFRYGLVGSFGGVFVRAQET